MADPVELSAGCGEFETLIAAVKRHFDREEFDKALPRCNKALELQPNDTDVRRCRVFALLSLSKWADALQMCDKSACKQESFAFEKAYCLYRLNRFQEALDALDAAAPTDDAARRALLEAQIRYRMGDYEASAAMYEKLHEEDPEDVGLLVNAVASRVSGGQPQDALKVTADQQELLESSYELCFNLACAFIDGGRLAEAEVRLKEAKGICVSELLQAGEVSEKDTALLEDHEELAAIQVQRACVLQRRGANEEASELYSRVLRQRFARSREIDVTVLAVACNNIVILQPEKKSLVDSLKRTKTASKESLEHKLTRKQTIEIAINKCLLFMQDRKKEQARRELQQLSDFFPGHPRAAVIQAAIAFTERKVKACEEVLQAHLASHPESEEVLVPLAQFHTQQNCYDKAVEALEQLPVRRRAEPQILAAIVALHQKQKNPGKAVASLRLAIDHWKGQEDKEGEETFASVLRMAARLAIQLKDRGFAAEVFQLHLERIDGSDIEALCGLVQAFASTDVERAQEYAQRLRVPSYDHFDPEELEGAPIPKMGFSVQKRDAEGAEAETPEKAKKKRKHKPRNSTGVDPENPGAPAEGPKRGPDNKTKAGKRDKNPLRGPQGAMPTEDTAFRKQGPSTAQVEVSKDTSRPSRNQGRKKKDKK